MRKNKIVSLLFFGLIFLLQFILYSCGSNENAYQNSVEIYECWNMLHHNPSKANVSKFNNLIQSYDLSNFNFYPDVLFTVQQAGREIDFQCRNILKLLELAESSPQENYELKLMEFVSNIDKQMIIYIRCRNNITYTSQQRYITFYSLLVGFTIIVVSVLIILNERELKKKNIRITQSEIMLRHTMEVQEAERARISRELHDTVAQSMRYVSLMAEKIHDKELSEEIIGAQNSNIEDIRKLCYNLTPPNFSTINFLDSLNVLAGKVFGATRTQIRIVKNGEINFSIYTEEQLINLYRIIQEIFQNTYKHANASELTVLFRKEEKLKIIISDDGDGMDEKLVADINAKNISFYQNLHFGLKNILERIQLLNGSIEFRSEEALGTTIVIEM